MTDAVALRRRSRAVGRLLPALGTRWVAVTDATTLLARSAVSPPLVVVATEPGWDGGAPVVRGTGRAVPVQSESATGVLVALRDGAAAAAAAPEAARLLQPGGVALFHAVWRARDVRPFDDALREAGLESTRRVAVRRPDAAPSAWAWLDARRARAASGEESVECLVEARRPGGIGMEVPTAGSMLASFVLPQAWRGAQPWQKR